MKLITFQTPEAFNELKEKGILKVPKKATDLINLKKYGIPYDFIVEQMTQKIPSQSDEKYPLWAWAKWGHFIAPKKRKNLIHKKQHPYVKITFCKPKNQVLLSDYMAYSFILNGRIVPQNKNEYKKFLKEIENLGISLDELKMFVRKDPNKKVEKIYSKIKKTWPRIFHLKSTIHQACVWNIKWEEIEKIEICDNPEYLYNSANPIRKDGTRPDWKKEYLKFIP